MPLYFCRSSRYLIVKWPLILLLLKLSNFGIFLSGIPSKLNTRNFWYSKKDFLPLYFCRSSRYLIVKWPLIVILLKLSNFGIFLSVFSNRSKIAHFTTWHQVERQIWSGKYFFCYIKNSLCWIWKGPHSKKFGIQHFKWSGKNGAANIFCSIWKGFDNFCNRTENG